MNCLRTGTLKPGAFFSFFKPFPILTLFTYFSCGGFHSSDLVKHASSIYGHWQQPSILAFQTYLLFYSYLTMWGMISMATVLAPFSHVSLAMQVVLNALCTANQDNVH
jgi:hypothetical protein